MASRLCHPRLLVLAAASAVLLGAPMPAADGQGHISRSRVAAQRRRRVFDVRAFGASGDGRRDDAPAINRAIAAANAAGGGVVELPPGTYLAGGSIHMRSYVTLRLDAHATLLGARSGYDPPEPNPHAAYTDPGHAHFHDAMIWGEDLRDIGFVGTGTIDGGPGDLITSEPIRGRADKLISLVRCTNLTISGITIRRGGHFAILTNDCNHIVSDGLTIQTAQALDGRDGWDVINAHDVRIRNITIHSYDDALVFKSDWALGERLPNGNVTVTDARLSSVCCNALMFGSETCGDFSNYSFSHVAITGAGKSGLGMVTMDGARISNVRYSHITMSDVAGAIMEKIGDRRRCGDHPGIGSISDIRYDHISGVSQDVYSPTLWGVPGHRISDVSFDDVHLLFAGGHAAVPASLPSDEPELFDPNSIGPRPAYGFYLHDVRDVTFSDSSLTLAAPDARPALVAQDATGLRLRQVLLQAGSGSPFEVHLQGVRGADVVQSNATTGAPLRIQRTAAPPCAWCTLDPPSAFAAAVQPAPPPPVAEGSI